VELGLGFGNSVRHIRALNQQISVYIQIYRYLYCIIVLRASDIFIKRICYAMLCFVIFW